MEERGYCMFNTLLRYVAVAPLPLTRQSIQDLGFKPPPAGHQLLLATFRSQFSPRRSLTVGASVVVVLAVTLWPRYSCSGGPEHIPVMPPRTRSCTPRTGKASKGTFVARTSSRAPLHRIRDRREGWMGNHGSRAEKPMCRPCRSSPEASPTPPFPKQEDHTGYLTNNLPDNAGWLALRILPQLRQGSVIKPFAVWVKSIRPGCSKPQAAQQPAVLRSFGRWAGVCTSRHGSVRAERADERTCPRRWKRREGHRRAPLTPARGTETAQDDETDVILSVVMVAPTDGFQRQAKQSILDTNSTDYRRSAASSRWFLEKDWQRDINQSPPIVLRQGRKSSAVQTLLRPTRSNPDPGTRPHRLPSEQPVTSLVPVARRYVPREKRAGLAQPPPSTDHTLFLCGEDFKDGIESEGKRPQPSPTPAPVPIEVCECLLSVSVWSPTALTDQVHGPRPTAHDDERPTNNAPPGSTPLVVRAPLTDHLSVG
ncbi:hypothetical protein CCHR01_17414 [Colletotrichum chrysophilum]|uniref:Uncharacterized protein n=1 Tax=Colletotrichum chrysophilum TaxID=1836956 RepID=A0AAD9ECH5_9PEZI|nr:hypothetical protein CCHR01_17414 [Colletotrichum chrysophilum]